MSQLNQRVGDVLKVLANVVENFSPAVFANSFGAEDMVLTDLIAKHYPEIEMFSLDTGRLPQPTYDLMQTLRGRYSLTLQVYFPKDSQVEGYVAKNGVNGFYDSVEARKACCHVRKVAPLKRALNSKKAWITGLRREQATVRANLELAAFDADNGLHKFNPLLEWTHAEVWEYIKSNDVPYNRLHDQFLSLIHISEPTRPY